MCSVLGLNTLYSLSATFHPVCWGRGGDLVMDEHPVQGRVVILLVASCYENWDNLHLGGPIGLSIVQNFYYMYHFTHSEYVSVQWLLFICFCIDVDNFFQITNHTQTICPLKVINCPYQYLGCKRKVCTNMLV